MQGTYLTLLPHRGADVHAVDDIGRSALLYATFKGSLACVEQLLAAGASVHVAEANDGMTALMWAAGYGHPQLMEPLLAAGAEVDAENFRGRTALWNAAAYCQLETARLCIENGADVNRGDECGSPPLMIACRYGHAEGVNLLLEHGADPHTVDVHGRNALIYAAGGGSADVVSALRQRGADVHQADNNGTTALLLATNSGFGHLVAPLLVNKQNVNGCTAPYFAVNRGQVAVAERLLEVRDANGLLPVQLALLRLRGDVAHCLLQIGQLPQAVEPVLQMLARANRTKLMAVVAARVPLSPAGWQLFPPSCPGLSSALPAVLALSPAEAALLVAHLPPAERARARCAAPSLARAQREAGVELPPALVTTILGAALA
ncbi:hypothetical protein COHA_010004 [Chlorella ohadii]|uniref:Uncharacterized protein n=1 Tax=Chlorella ohadii TaxID=2649997 RepID=A0AAD5DDK1_9CHLO|nr:hypothetical protein COHA_010004 [Chlorella ohadii]